MEAAKYSKIWAESQIRKFWTVEMIEGDDPETSYDLTYLIRAAQVDGKLPWSLKTYQKQSKSERRYKREKEEMF